MATVLDEMMDLKCNCHAMGFVECEDVLRRAIDEMERLQKNVAFLLETLGSVADELSLGVDSARRNAMDRAYAAIRTVEKARVK